MTEEQENAVFAAQILGANVQAVTDTRLACLAETMHSMVVLAARDGNWEAKRFVSDSAAETLSNITQYFLTVGDDGGGVFL
jgi:hypothetical protein